MIFAVKAKCLSVARAAPRCTGVWTNRRTVARDNPVASESSVSVIVGVCPKASITSRPRANDWTNSPGLVSGCINEFNFGFRLQLVEAQTKQGPNFNGARIRELKDAVIGVQARNTAHTGQRVSGFWHEFDVAITGKQVHHDIDLFGADG